MNDDAGTFISPFSINGEYNPSTLLGSESCGVLPCNPRAGDVCFSELIRAASPCGARIGSGLGGRKSQEDLANKRRSLGLLFAMHSFILEATTPCL